MKDLIKGFYKENKASKRWKDKLARLLNSKEKEEKFIEFKNSEFGFLENPTDYQIIWHVINDDHILRTCKNCGKPTKFNRQFFYHELCSRSCVATYTGQKPIEERKRIVQKAKETCIERYGVDSITKLQSAKDQKKRTCLEKYGVENPLQRKDIQEKQFKKMQETNMERYGVKSTLSNKETWDKYQKTMIEKYGVDNPWESEEIAEKRNKSISEKWKKDGADIIKKIQNTNLKRYGKKYYTETDEYKDKYMNKEWFNRFYDYLTPSGKIRRIQGYEKFALDILFKDYDESDIITNKKPKIEYIHEGICRRYILDILIKSENKIIEVKSPFTYKNDLSKNIAKAKGSLMLGYKFEFWIFKDKNNLEVITMRLD